MNKKGISLIVLVITVILLMILLGVTTTGIGNAVKNSRRSAFASDLSSLEDATNVYYIQNGEFPVLEENGEYIEYVYNSGKIEENGDTSNYITVGNTEIFEQELKTNSDITDGENVVSNTVFYKIDLNKIDVEKIKRGTGTEGNNDIYVMAYPSQTIYYLKGLNVGDNVYFSLANLTNLVNVSDDETTATDQTEIVQTVSGMTIKRIKKAWTNTLDITIDAYLESNESIYIQIPQSTTSIEKKLSTVTGQNIITLKTFESSLELTNEQVEDFNNLSSDKKYILVIKKQDGIVVANVKIDISNYETQTPEFPLKEDGVTYDFNIVSNESDNLVTFKASDNISGIKEVRYIYLKKFDEYGIPKAVYTDNDQNEILEFTPEYMQKNGKKAYVSGDGNVEINLPKDIEAIYITMFDKAGNNISMQKNVQTDIYAGINLKNISTNLIFGYAIKSSSDILSATTQISVDNVNYTSEQSLTLTKNSDGIYTSTATFEKGVENEVYVKLVVKNNDGITETRIKKIDVSEKAYELLNSVIPGVIYSENKTYIDKNGDKAVLPAGFKVSSNEDEQVIDNGLVIIDKLDNEFVWVPCTTNTNDTTKIQYTKRFDEYPKTSSITSVSDDTDALPTVNDTTIDETEQINTYGGFYIGRYEAGVPANQTTIDGTYGDGSASKSDADGTPVVQRGATVWTQISYNKAMTNAKLLYESSTSVRSGLVTGTQWDTVCAWIQSEKDSENNPIHDVTNSTSWGNYSDTTGSAQYDTDGTTKISGTKQTAGYSQYWKAKNIYDIAGNTFEWTGEICSSNRIGRGGNCNYNGSAYPSSYRFHYSTSYTSVHISFRLVLYVM